MSIRLAASPILAGLLASTAALAEVPSVATDIPPVHSLVARVMGDLGDPGLIVQPGSSPHGYSMRPSEARSVQDAEAIFWIGPELTPWMDEALKTLAPEAEVIELLEVDGTQALEFREGATFADHDHADHEDDHDAEEAGGEDAHEGEEDHGHEGIDPHAWLDPENGKVWLDSIATTLGELDPENAATYEANAESGKVEIDAAAAQARELLAPLSDLQFVVFHDAYHYYESRFDLSAAGAIELSDATDPSPARIEDVRDTVRELGVSCVFSEPQFNQSLIGTVTEGTEARRGIIDPLGTEIALGVDFYPELIVKIAEEIASCAE
ncbi:zinc ABC transporter substrate-binding protein [Histidinibacterium aquaticum]|uniref:High-affinity zinc uptake system protein ZnuA n=1 Tax=Histidinibacterium aquaticum TaxID=2613962 RepID=A0A5J5GN47_9RHOB|nr:zinc ABC transporter substrate-binding protein [Histidinibacterium aquaticum]KAA9009761.1 zinc transporter [Histidinibacterium aquaticum]